MMLHLLMIASSGRTNVVPDVLVCVCVLFLLLLYDAQTVVRTRTDVESFGHI